MEKNFDFYKKPDEIKAEAKEIMNGSWGYTAKQMSLVFILGLLVVGGLVTLCVLKPLWYVIVPACFVGVFLIYVLYHGVQVFCYNLTNNLNVSSASMFAGFPKIFKLLALYISKIFVLLFGLCMFIFFGFKFELYYSMTSFYLFDNQKSSASLTLKGSKRLMKGNLKRLSKLRLKNIGWFVLCLTIVGMLWALPYLMVQKSVFYNDLKTDF